MFAFLAILNGLLLPQEQNKPNKQKSPKQNKKGKIYKNQPPKIKGHKLD